MKHLKFLLCILVVSSSAVYYSCKNDDWDNHYHHTDEEVYEGSLSDYIGLQDSMSIFYKLLELTGYDSILSYNQCFTVWVPINTALEGVDTTDEEAALEIVENHIARFSYSTSTTREDKVYMLNGKKISFVGDVFGDCSLLKENIRVSNGVLHEIDPYVPYEPNIWEYLDRIEDLDSISAYLTSLTTEEFDEYNSTIVDYLDDGSAVYDSVFSEENDFLDEVADLDDEDTTYTVFFPTNKAWNSTYAIISKYFKVPEDDGGDSLQIAYTKETLVSNLAYSGEIDEPLPDSLESTVENVIENPDSVFMDRTAYDASNGRIYVCDSLNLPIPLWYDTIRIEAENSEYGRSFSNATLKERTYTDTVYDVSEDEYLEAGVASGVSLISKVYVDFPIPNTLSAKYNVYVIFLPESVYYSSKNRPNKVSVKMSYIGDDGNVVENESLVSSQLTNTDDTTKMFIGQMDFKYCNMYDESSEDSDVDDIKVVIRVLNEQRKSSTTISQEMRIDCILFEPVEE